MPTTIRPGDPPASPGDALARTRELLAIGRTAEAQASLPPRSSEPTRRDPAVENARAVCLMRGGDPEGALEILRELVLEEDSVIVSGTVPRARVINLATALLLCGNVEGCAFALDDVEDDEPAKAPLVAAIRAWEGGLSRWQRLRRALGSSLPGPRLDFPPGVVP